MDYVGTTVEWEQRALAEYDSDHEQHIGASSCRSRLESQWETPQLPPPPQGAKTIGDQAENWQRWLPRVSDEAGIVSHLQPFGGWSKHSLNRLQVML